MLRFLEVSLTQVDTTETDYVKKSLSETPYIVHAEISEKGLTARFSVEVARYRLYQKKSRELTIEELKRNASDRIYQFLEKRSSEHLRQKIRL